MSGTRSVGPPRLQFTVGHKGGGGDIFLLIGYCATGAEILDTRRTVAQRTVRYDAMIFPFWSRDGAASALWTSQTSIDTALTGEPWASSWMVYCAGGIMSRQFDLSPSSAEIRTIQDCYRFVGQECASDPVGISQTHPITNTVGNVAVITTEWGRAKSDAPTYRCSTLIRTTGLPSLGLNASPRDYNPLRRKRWIFSVAISRWWSMQLRMIIASGRSPVYTRVKLRFISPAPIEIISAETPHPHQRGDGMLGGLPW